MTPAEALLIADDSEAVEYPNGVFEKMDGALRVLAAEVRRLHTIVDEQRRAIETLMAGMPDDGTTPVIRRIAAMELEIERLRADASRYRWLRSTTNYATSNGERIDVRNQPDLWDAAIDAAMKVNKEKT